MIQRLNKLTYSIASFSGWHFASAALALSAYLATIAPGVYTFDSAELATGAYTLGIVHPTGYPTYLLLGKLMTFLPVGSVAYRVNLLSAVLGALTVWNVTRILHRLTKDRAAALLGALSLAFLHSFWTMSIVAEVYTLHTFLFSLAVLLLLSWVVEPSVGRLALLAFILGLSLTNHVSSALLLPGFLMVLMGRGDRRVLIRAAPAAGAAFLLGLLPYVYLPLRDLANPELNYVRSYYGVDLQTWQGLLWMVSGRAYRFFAFSYDLAGYIGEIARFGAALLRGYTTLGLILAAVGSAWFTLRDRVLAAAAFYWFAATALFFSGYAVADKLTMFLGAYVVVSIWLGLGLARIRSLTRALNFSPGNFFVGKWSQIMALTSAAMVVSVFVFTLGRVDKSQAYESDLFARQVLGSLEPNAVVMAQWSAAVTLEYYRDVEGLRPDIEIFNRSRFAVAHYYRLWEAGYSHEEILRHIADLERDFVQRAEANRPVYGTEYDPILANSFEYLPVGNVYRIVASR